MARLAIRLFGSLQVTLDGKPVEGITSDKVRALLAYLVMSPDQPQRREKLAGLLWPDFPERSARTNLRNALANLRKVIGDQYAFPRFLQITRQTIQFNQNSDYWLDVVAFTSTLAASQPDITALQDVVSLYRGEFLEGFFIADSIAFEDWSLVKREHYHRQVIETLRRIIEIFELQGEYEGGLPYAWRLVGIEPWDEAGHRALMRLLVLSGHRSEALTQFEKCRQVLVDELGVEPSVETTTLYETIRSGKFAKSVELPTEGMEKVGLPLQSSLSAYIENLPSVATPFIGRDEELAALNEILVDTNVRLVTIVGPGGIGKTRLAIQTAEEMLAGGGMLFRNGVYFVSLETVYDTDAIVSAVAGALGFQFYEEGENAQGQVVDYLRGKRLLLVLDNFEQLIGESSAELLAEMLHASPGLKILITSRERLNQPGEQVYSVGGMHIPDIDNLDWEGQAIENGFEYSGVTLFLQTARRSQVDFIPDKQEMIAIMEICHLVKGMPLGIELAAAWVPVLRPRAFLEEIRASLDILETNMHSIPARQRSLRAVFDASWKLLSVEERNAVMRLSVFRGGFTRHSAAQVAGVSIKALLDLVNKSWIQTSPDERYNFHPVVHFYASEAADGQLKTIKQRHAEYFCSFISESKDELYGQLQNETLIEMEAEISNQKDAWKTAIELERFDLIDQATHGYCTYFDLRSRFEEGVHACATAVDALERAQYADSSEPGKPKPGSCLLVKLLTWSAHFTLDYQKQASLIDQALALFDDPGFPVQECQPTQAQLWCVQGQHIAWEDRVRSGEYFQRSMELASKLGDRYLQALAMASLGWASWVTGDVDWAKKQFQMSLDIRREIGDQRGISYCLNMLGILVRDQGRLGEAEALQRESLVFLEEIGATFQIAQHEYVFSYTIAFQGDFPKALQIVTRSEQRFIELGYRGPFLARPYQIKGNILLDLGRYDEAQANAHLGLKIAKQYNDQQNIANALGVLGSVCLIRADFETALEYLTDSYERMVAIKHPRALIPAVKLVSANRRVGNLDQGLEYLRIGIKMLLKSKKGLFAGYALSPAALCLIELGADQLAVTVYTLAQQFPNIANSRWVSDIYGEQMHKFLALLPNQTVREAEVRAEALDIWDALRLVLDVIETYR